MPMPAPAPASASDADWSYCQSALERVSRTFSQPIRMLPGDLSKAVSCGYLLCRLVDTIEDDAGLQLAERDRLYQRFLEVLEGHAPPEALQGMAREVFGSGRSAARPDEVELFQQLPAIWRVLHSLPAAMPRRILPWVAEMARGMAIYSHREVGADGFQALLTLGDLERYCFFVAGTVGHMLTQLFTDALPELDAERRARLGQHAEDFALALQLTNILKDVPQDLERGVSFIPRALCESEGVSVPQLSDPSRLPEAKAAVAPIFARAEAAMSGALEYTLALPAHATGIRLFCVLPLVMAARTLALTQQSPSQFDAAVVTKISRDEVYALIGRATREVGDDTALRGWVAELRAAPAALPSAPGPLA